MTDDLFTGDQGDQPKTPTEDAPDTIADLLSKIKNDQGGQKYGDVNKALEALSHSQSYIPTLKSELEEANAKLVAANAKLEASENVESIVNKLLEKPPVIEEPQHHEVPIGMDETQVAAMIADQHAKNEDDALATANADQVATALKSKYGETWKEEAAKKATELKMSTEQLSNLSHTSPELVISLFNAGAPSSSPPTTSSMNTSSFQNTSVQTLDKPDKSLLSGATSQEQKAYLLKIREQVYLQHGVTT